MAISKKTNQLAILGGDRTLEWVTPQRLVSEKAVEAVTEIAASGQWWMGKEGHSAVQALETAMRESQSTQYALGVTNGTHALEILLRNLGVGIDDQVAIPAYAPSSVAAAVLIIGAIPVCIDVCPDTMTMDPDALQASLTPKVKAILFHYLSGVAGAIDGVLAIAKKNNLPVIEDCRYAYSAQSKGRPVGSLGSAGAFDFQTGQMVSGGEGGVIVTQDADLYERCWSQHNCGRRRGKSRGEYVEVGSNYRMAAFQAALIQVQQQQWATELPQFLQNLAHMDQVLAQLKGITPQYRDPQDQAPTWRYLFRYESQAFENLPISLFVTALQAEGVPCEPSPYVALHQTALLQSNHLNPSNRLTRPGQLRSDDEAQMLPRAEQLTQTVVAIPFTRILGTDPPIAQIVEAIEKVRYHAVALVQGTRAV
ncbi:MAG: DegT/DnrJ/EryC1/StrS family aminotransferase [Thermosynechococcaceae cyanobacterium]